jgi:hypothetical protein
VRELAQGASDDKRVENDLWHHLIEDIINGRFDRKRSGLAFIQPDNRTVPVKGRLLVGKLNLPLRRYSNRILVRKKAVLDFARRHRLPPPSWWYRSELRPADVTTVKEVVGRTRTRRDYAGQRPRAEPDPKKNKTWRAKPGVRLTKAEAAVLDALNAISPNGRLDHNAKARDGRINKELKENGLTPVSSRTIQRTLERVDPPTSRDVSRLVAP